MRFPSRLVGAVVFAVWTSCAASLQKVDEFAALEFVALEQREGVDWFRLSLANKSESMFQCILLQGHPLAEYLDEEGRVVAQWSQPCWHGAKTLFVRPGEAVEFEVRHGALSKDASRLRIFVLTAGNSWEPVESDALPHAWRTF